MATTGEEHFDAIYDALEGTPRDRLDAKRIMRNFTPAQREAFLGRAKVRDAQSRGVDTSRYERLQATPEGQYPTAAGEGATTAGPTAPGWRDFNPQPLAPEDYTSSVEAQWGAHLGNVPSAVAHSVVHPLTTLGNAARNAGEMLGMGGGGGAPQEPTPLGGTGAPLGQGSGQPPMSQQVGAAARAAIAPAVGLATGPFTSMGEFVATPDTQILERPLEAGMNAAMVGGAATGMLREPRGPMEPAVPPQQPDPVVPPPTLRRPELQHRLPFEQGEQATTPRTPTQQPLPGIPQPRPTPLRGGEPIVERAAPPPPSEPAHPYLRARHDLEQQLTEPVAGTMEGGPKEPLHPVQAIIDEAQLVNPTAKRGDLRARWATDREGLLDEIAHARAAQGDPTRPINRPLGEFPTSRLQELRTVRDRLERYQMGRPPRRPASAAPTMDPSIVSEPPPMQPHQLDLEGLGPWQPQLNLPFEPAPGPGGGMATPPPRGEYWAGRRMGPPPPDRWPQLGRIYEGEFETGSAPPPVEGPPSAAGAPPPSAAPPRAPTPGAAPPAPPTPRGAPTLSLLGDRRTGPPAARATFQRLRTQMWARSDLTPLQKAAIDEALRDEHATLTPERAKEIANEVLERRAALDAAAGPPHIPTYPLTEATIADAAAGLEPSRPIVRDVGTTTPRAEEALQRGRADRALREEQPHAPFASRIPEPPVPRAPMDDAATVAHITQELASPTAPPPTTPAISRVGADVAEPASRLATAIVAMGRPIAGAAGRALAVLGHMYPESRGLDPVSTTHYLNTMFEGIAHVVETQASTRPRLWREAMFVPPSMDAAATRHIAANRSAFVMATQMWEMGGPTEIFKRGTTPFTRRRWVRLRERNALRLLWDDRAHAVEARQAQLTAHRASLEAELQSLQGAAGPDAAKQRTRAMGDLAALPHDLTSHRYPMLTDMERTEIMRDPAMQDFTRWFRDTWTPAVEHLSGEAGVERRLVGPLGGYVSFVDAWVDPRSNRPGVMARGQGRRSPYDVRPRRPRGAQRATGAAPDDLVLSDDLFRYFYTTVSDRMTSITKANLMEEVRKGALTTATTASAIGQVPLDRTTIATSRGPREVPVRKITLERLGGRTEDIYYLPEPHARMFDVAVAAPTKHELQAMSALNSALTAQIVVLPAEAVRHSWNVASAVTTTEWFAKYGHTARATEALTGAYGKMATALYRAYNLSGPEFAARIQRMADSNALRLSGWERSPESPSLIQRTATGLPVVGRAVKGLKDFAFGYPGTSKGLRGIETRLRIAVEMAMEDMDPHMSDPQYGRRLNDNLGSYVKEIVPPLADKMSALYPFARARTALVKQGLRTLGGRDILGHLNPYIATATMATIGQVLVLNKLLDDQHRWPWEVPGWTPLSLAMFEWNGHKVSLGPDLVVNSLYRATKATGISAAVEGALAGRRDPSDYVSAFGRAHANFLMSWVGPGVSTLMTATTGKAPYITRGGDLLTLEEHTMAGAEESRLHARLKAVYHQAIPAMAKSNEWAAASGYAPRPTTEPWNTLFTTAEYLGVAPTISGVASEDAAKASAYYMDVNDARAVAFEAAARARNISDDPAIQLEYIRDHVARHTTPSTIVMDGKDVKAANVYAFEIAVAAWRNSAPRRTRGAAMGPYSRDLVGPSRPAAR